MERNGEVMKEKIIELCVDILAHSSLDYEITLCGNGYNAFECEGVALELLDILGMSYEEIKDRIADRTKIIK